MLTMRSGPTCRICDIVSRRAGCSYSLASFITMSTISASVAFGVEEQRLVHGVLELSSC